MTRKLVSAGAAAAMMLATATPVFAGGHRDHHQRDVNKLTVANYASVSNYVKTEAETGDNTLTGEGTILTGSALAGSDLTNFVNWTSVAGCDCFDEVTVANAAYLSNYVKTEAETGDNSLVGVEQNTDRHHRHHDSEGSESVALIDTGDAGASSVVANDVNTTIVGGVVDGVAE